MKKTLIAVLSGICLFTACVEEKIAPETIIADLYSPDQLPAQAFVISNLSDTTLTSKSGTTFRISKNTFTGLNGEPITKPVVIELKEALKPTDIVMANLTTTFNGQPLQSGGMIYLDAKSAGSQLKIADNKAIVVSIKPDSILTDMQLFEGVQDCTGISWVNPVALNPEIRSDSLADNNPLPPDALPAVNPAPLKNDTIARTNVAYNVEGYDPRNYPPALNEKISTLLWRNGGLIITKDSTVKIDSFTVNLFKTEIPGFNVIINDEQNLNVGIAPVLNNNSAAGFTEPATVTGINGFRSDHKTSYIFSLKKLGWANIDRLFSDPRSKEVELITAIEKKEQFSQVYITMITCQMYLPGYEMKNGNYGFTHGDFEKPRLPVGAEATIMATAYKDGKLFFVLKKIIISEQQTVILDLKETTEQQLKEELELNL